MSSVDLAFDTRLSKYSSYLASCESSVPFIGLNLNRSVCWVSNCVLLNTAPIVKYFQIDANMSTQTGGKKLLFSFYLQGQGEVKKDKRGFFKWSSWTEIWQRNQKRLTQYDKLAEAGDNQEWLTYKVFRCWIVSPHTDDELQIWIEDIHRGAATARGRLCIDLLLYYRCLLAIGTIIIGME